MNTDMDEKENAVILRGKKYVVVTQKGFKGVCKKCDLGHVLWCWEFCDVLVDCPQNRNDNVPYFKEDGTDEEEFALILEGKKYRILACEESRGACKVCDFRNIEKCTGFCVAIEHFYNDHHRENYVYFEEIKQ